MSWNEHLAYHAEGEWKKADDGAFRWNRSGNVIPKDIVAHWAEAGLVTRAEQEAHLVAHETDLKKFLGEYRKAQAARTPEQLAEEAFEMRAAFGPGQKVVNIVTGEVTTT